MTITHEPISLEAFFGDSPTASCGASVHFVGIVRNHQDGRAVKRLYYECYESMAEQQIAEIAERMRRGHGVDRIRVLHRVGWLEVGDAAVVIEASAAHRAEAFSACHAMIDEIKKTVPIWKKEVYEDLSEEWVICNHKIERS